MRDYNAQLEWMHSLIADRSGLRYFEPRTPEERLHAYQESLRRTADFLDFAGNPQASLPIAHVAGTSGKGSVSVILAALLQASGQRTACHTSPYLQVATEKFSLDGRLLSGGGFASLVQDFRSLYAAYSQAGREFSALRHNEAWMALTYLWFSHCGADWAVMETGVGGRYDPSNVAPSRIAVITNVDYDHVLTLGPALQDIARHKAGIIKTGQAVITAATQDIVLNEIKREADLKQAPLYMLHKDFEYSLDHMDENGVTFSVQTPVRKLENLHLPLRGRFQAVNAALALSALDILTERYQVFGSDDALRAALETVNFPGRMEVVQRTPLVILDSAHNPHKMASLVESLPRLYPGRRVWAVVGMLMTKDAEALLKVLLPGVERVVATQPQVLGKPSVPAEDLAGSVRALSAGKLAHVAADVNAALDYALSQTVPDDLLLVTGSLYLVGQARNRWFDPEKLLG